MNTAPLEIPAEWASTRSGQLGTCARHGRPAVRRVDFALQSRPEMSRLPYEQNALTIVARLGERGRKVKVTDVRNWPLCAACVRRRRLGLSLANLLFWLGLASFVGAVVARLALSEPHLALLAPAIGGPALMLLAVVPFVYGSLSRVTGAVTSTDGRSVLIERADPRFAAELPSQRGRR